MSVYTVFRCDRCDLEERHDFAGWTETDDGEDLCPACSHRAEAARPVEPGGAE